MRQYRLEASPQIHSWIDVKHNLVHIIQGHLIGSQNPIGGVQWISIGVLFAIEPLFFGISHKLAVEKQGCAGIMKPTRNTKNVHWRIWVFRATA